MDWNLIIACIGAVLGGVGAICAYFSTKNSNKTIEKIELTKQEFAKENEELKRKQAVYDNKQKLVGDFLSTIVKWSPETNSVYLPLALDTGAKVLTVLDDPLKTNVNQLLATLKNYDADNYSYGDGSSAKKTQTAINTLVKKFIESNEDSK